MTPAASPLITRWATQTSRDPAAFALERTQLDPRDLPDLLADIARLAADIPFHDDAGKEDGDWRKILLADQSFVLALLATAGIDNRAESLRALLADARTGGTPRENEQRLTGLVEALLAFADDLDAWLGPADLGGVMRGQSIRRLAESTIERVLGPQLQRLFDEVVAVEEAELTERFHHDRDRWDAPRRPWRRAMLEGEARGVAEAVERAWTDRMLAQLADAIEGFIDEMRELEERAAAAFAATLASGDHSPHPAMVIAFARLFGHARDLLNAVPQQFIDFYQLQLLRAAPAPPRPDRMLLAAIPKPGTRPKLPKGMLIPAGKDVTFTTDAALDVTGAVLREARLWRPVDGGATVARLMAGPDGALGDPALGIAAPLRTDAFEMHAIFSTPLLALAGGTRRIELELGLNGIADASTAALEASVSTAEGWCAVPAIDCTIHAGMLAVSFTLPPNFPALAPCPPGADTVPLPALRLTLGAGPLTGARVVDARLTIAVKDVPGLTIRTPSGPASPDAAAPFGAPPWPGGWLRIDHPVLAGPPLDRLVLRFDWAGLPPGDGGFADYYRGYVVDRQGQLFDWPPFDNAVFAVTLAAPVHGWGASQRLPLFGPASLDSAPPVAAAPPPNIFAAEFEPAPPLMPERGTLAPGSWLAAAASDGGGALPDHICVTLAAPAHGFGHALHAANVQYATEAIARGDAPPPARPGFLRRLLHAILGFPRELLRKIEGIEDTAPDPGPETLPVLLPSPPFQPLLSAIALDYAQSVVDGLTLHHAATLAGPVAIPLEGSPLFPAAPDALTLDLYFDGAQPGDVLALLVRLAPGDCAGPPPAYSYCATTGWAPLPTAALLADETAGLTLTGILRIAVPADAARPIALRLDFADATDPPPIVALTPDAVAATRLIHGGETAMPPVPAGTVTKLPGLARVVQPLDTAGGQPPEPPAMRRARMAERVRHRGRAVTAWDMEMLVLAEFPVACVRVFVEADPAEHRSVGTVTVVAIPGSAAPPAQQLRAGIAARLAELASPFAHIMVVDPVPVPVDVTARLILAGSDIEPVRSAVTALLSAAPGLDLPDHADADQVRAKVLEALLRDPQVHAVDSLTVTLGAAGIGWRVPVAGAIDLTGVAARAVASW